MKKKRHFLQYKEKHKNTKEDYTDGLKSIGKQGFAAIFMDITRREALHEEASIHTAKMTIIKIAVKEIYKKADKRQIIYIDFQSFMQSIEYKKENHVL